MKTVAFFLFALTVMASAERVNVVEHNPEQVQVVDHNPEQVHVVDNNPNHVHVVESSRDQAPNNGYEPISFGPALVDRPPRPQKPNQHPGARDGK